MTTANDLLATHAGEPEHSAIYISKRLMGDDSEAAFIQGHINQAVSEAIEKYEKDRRAAPIDDGYLGLYKALHQTLAPAFDYMQTHQAQFGIGPGEDMTPHIVRVFLADQAAKKEAPASDADRRDAENFRSIVAIIQVDDDDSKLSPELIAISNALGEIDPKSPLDDIRAAFDAARSKGEGQ